MLKRGPHMPLPFPDILHFSEFDIDKLCRRHFEHMQKPFNYMQGLMSVRTTRSRIEHVEIVDNRYLVAAGDCCQLPPLIANPTAMQPGPGKVQPLGLGRPLIARLMAMGYPCHLLRYQYRQALCSESKSCLGKVLEAYLSQVLCLQHSLDAIHSTTSRDITASSSGVHACRCHPVLSAIPNQLFYGGKLLDGCTSTSRAPLVSGLAALTCVHNAGTCMTGAGGHVSLPSICLHAL